MIGKLFTVARPQVIIVLLAGAFGVAERASAQVFSEFLIPTANSLSYAITTGPDDALWFVEYSSAKIGRITTAGAITEFTGLGNNPQGITAGPDRALWFTEAGNSTGASRRPARLRNSRFQRTTADPLVSPRARIRRCGSPSMTEIRLAASRRPARLRNS